MACPICRRDHLQFTMEPFSNADGRLCKCQGCGTYALDGALAEDEAFFYRMGPEERLRLSCAIRRATDERAQRPTITHENYKQIVVAEHLPDAIEQAERFIGRVARTARLGSPTTPELPEVWATRLCLHVAGLNELLEQLKDDVQIFWEDSTRIQFGLTRDGWRAARALRGSRAGSQAFVAMWFHDALRPAYTDGIKLALEATGYAPYRVDFAHHNRRIDDEIMRQIRESRLLIADATGARASVYFEAGFADGLGIPVIWCCNDAYRAHVIADVAPHMPDSPKLAETDWFKCVAFDTNHLPFLLWKEPADLKKLVEDRIRGLGLALQRA